MGSGQERSNRRRWRLAHLFQWPRSLHSQLRRKHPGPQTPLRTAQACATAAVVRLDHDQDGSCALAPTENSVKDAEAERLASFHVIPANRSIVLTKLLRQPRAPE